MEDPLYVTHQLEQFSLHASNPFGSAFSNDVRYLTWTRDKGSNPLFVKCADLLDALQAEETFLRRESKDVLGTPSANLVALDCKAVQDLKNSLSKAQSKEEAALDRVNDLRKRQLFQDSHRLAKAEAELEEARKMRTAIQKSYDARSRALVLAWKHDLSIAVLSHLQLVRDSYRRMAATLERESEWMERTMAQEEQTRKREFDALAELYASETSRVLSSGRGYGSAKSSPRPMVPTEPVPSATSTTATKGGSLEKPQGLLSIWSSKSSQWVRRWVVADDSRVAIYKSWRDGWPHKVLILTPWSKVSVAGVVVSLETDGQVLDHVTTQLKARTNTEAEEWSRSLAQMIEAAIGQDTSTMARRSVLLRPSSEITSFTSGTQFFPSSLEASQTLLGASGCSECGQEQGGSDWCCMQYGITMCEKCADAFKSSGFRSVLPTREIDIISMQLLLGTGNALAQVLWEGQKVRAQAARPAVSATLATRVAWIHTKYADRAFVVAEHQGSDAIKFEGVLAKTETQKSVHWVAAAILSEISQGTWNPEASIQGMPILHCMISHKPQLPKLDVLLLLAILNGCPIDGKMRGSFDTPLHVACASNCIEAARLLLLQGADDTLFNARGDLARALAVGACASLFDEGSPLLKQPHKSLPPVPKTLSNSVGGSTTNADEWALDQYLNSASLSSPLPELSGGGLTLASYENADLSVLSPRSGRKKDIAKEKKGKRGTAKTETEAPPVVLERDEQQRAIVDATKAAREGVLERDEQQRALVEAAKKEQSKKKRNARFIKLKDNIKFSVKSPPKEDDAKSVSAGQPRSPAKPLHHSGKAGLGISVDDVVPSGASPNEDSPRNLFTRASPRPGSATGRRRGSRLSFNWNAGAEVDKNQGNRAVALVFLPAPVVGVPSTFERKSFHCRVYTTRGPPPSLQATGPRSFEDRLRTLMKLRDQDIVSEPEFMARLVQMGRKPPDSVIEDGLERRLATLIELWARDLITQTELHDRILRLIKTSDFAIK